jgi:hypothetical protein
MLASMVLVFETHLAGKAPHLKHYDIVWREEFRVVHSEGHKYDRDHSGESEEDEYRFPELDNPTPVALEYGNWFAPTSANNARIREAVRNSKAPQELTKGWNLSNLQL